MATFDVSPRDYERLFMANETARARRVAHACQLAAAESVSIVAEATPEDHGALRQSVHLELGDLSGEFMAQVVVDAPYAAAVEVGTRPYSPPIQPLIAWVKRHPEYFSGSARRRARRGRTRSFWQRLGIARQLRSIIRSVLRQLGFTSAARTRSLGAATHGGRGSSAKPGGSISDAQARDIAFGIAARVAREGFKPRGYVRGTLRAQAAALARHAQQQVEDP
jgi:hypothetical protein